MNEYFSEKLAVRELCPERHARLVAGKLTKHSYDAVLTAATDLWDAHDEYLHAYAAWSETIDANTNAEDRRYPAWWRKYGPEIEALLVAHDRAFEIAPALGGNPAFNRRRHSGESYPISAWATKVRKYRTAAKQLRKAVEKFKLQAA